MVVIKNPEITKNISTPTKPPLNVSMPAWKRITDRTATPLSPSISFL
jgi:hypothetical protein